jgi:hypothetical protein
MAAGAEPTTLFCVLRGFVIFGETPWAVYTAGESRPATIDNHPPRAVIRSRITLWIEEIF